MTKEQQQMIDDFLQKMRELLFKKGHDYSGSDDTLKNFYAASIIDIDPGKGILLRILDKISRISNYIGNDSNLKVMDETIEDTLIDIANYAVLLHLLISKNQKQIKEKI